MSGAKIAMMTMQPRITNPTIAPGLRRSRSHASLQSPPPPDCSNETSLASSSATLICESLIRGLSTPYERSTSRLTKTTMTATKRTPPWMTG